MFKASACVKIILLLLLCGRVSAQVNNAMLDSIMKHAAYYNAKNPRTKLFAHLDKTVYAGNENLWFAAYLLGLSNANLNKHDVLMAALVNNNNPQIAAFNKYVMRAGFAPGSLPLSDTLPAGKYTFMAYTNRMLRGQPEICFMQPVIIKSAGTIAFDVELMVDTLYKDSQNTRVLVNVKNKNVPISNAAINYYLGKNVKTRIAGKGKTNAIGSFTILLPKTNITPDSHKLDVVITAGEQLKTMHLDLPQKTVVDVKFYPEGGHLIAGLTNRVGWEATTGGRPVKTTAVLLAGNRAVDTLNTDTYGMGAFYVNVLTNETYSVKLLNTDQKLVYPLPNALPRGGLLRLRDAIADDTLKVQFQSVGLGRYYLVLHNYRNVFLNQELKNGLTATGLRINLKGVPRGINTITVLDSLHRPCAEHVFFAHYTQKPKLDILIDDNNPGTRQNINIKLN